MGLSYAELSAINPRLIYVTLTGYGCDGPDSQRPGYDVIIAAEAGLMSITGMKRNKNQSFNDGNNFLNTSYEFFFCYSRIKFEEV